MPLNPYERMGTQRDPAADFAEQLARRCPLLDGRLLTVDLAATTDPQTFRHGLGRAYRGGIVVAQDHSVGIVVVPALTEDARHTIILAQLSATAQTATLWVF